MHSTGTVLLVTGFFESWEQCLQSRIGCSFPAYHTRLLILTLDLWPPGNCPVLCLYGLSYTLPVLTYTATHLVRKHFPVCPGSVPRHNFKTCCRHKSTILDGNWNVINIPNLTLSLPVSKSLTAELGTYQQEKLVTHHNKP